MKWMNVKYNNVVRDLPSGVGMDEIGNPIDSVLAPVTSVTDETSERHYL